MPSDQVAYSLIGASWGDQITDRGLIALAVFLALVALVIWVYFRDGKMAGAALVALAHDVLLTIGIYALVGFTVTPATLIGVTPAKLPAGNVTTARSWARRSGSKSGCTVATPPRTGDTVSGSTGSAGIGPGR